MLGKDGRRSHGENFAQPYCSFCRPAEEIAAYTSSQKSALVRHLLRLHGERRQAHVDIAIEQLDRASKDIAAYVQKAVGQAIAIKEREKKECGDEAKVLNDQVCD